MKKYVYLAALVASVLLTIHLFRVTRQLRNQVQQLEEERKRAALATISAGWVGISEDEQERMLGIYREIAQAYTNRDIMAMRIAMLKLPEVNDHLTWQISPKIERPLFALFNDSFLRTTRLLDFDTPAQFDAFAKSNIEVALFLGGGLHKAKMFRHCVNYGILDIPASQTVQGEIRQGRQGRVQGCCCKGTCVLDSMG